MPIPAIGEPAPPFRATLSNGRDLVLDNLAGRFTTLCFFGSAGVPQMAEMARAIASNAEVFDGLDHQFIGVSIDPDDEMRSDILFQNPPAVRWIWDFDQSLSRLYGAVGDPEPDGDPDDVSFQPLTVLLDASMRVLACHRIDDPVAHAGALAQFLNALPTFGPPRPALPQAPVLFVPMAFEAEFCKRLIAHFEELGGAESGILEDIDGRTELVFDPSRKRRQDLLLNDETLQQAAHARIARRIAPEIRKSFQFTVTRLERSAIARYGVGDFFAPHRDNTALGTTHRMFSITIPLNADGYMGGHLRFPEFGPQVYQIPSGCAVVHSCGLLHEILPIREGTRYAFVPIVYGEEAAQVREKNREFLGEGVTADRRELRTSADAP
ncbi:MAG: redoxin domain-containing protein [Alphaproteobacteria bacterium]|jgi:peroxiredoxin/predicted 2-oxoglutarate/Fe(II)-dependent dioxygenase YbiX